MHNVVNAKSYRTSVKELLDKSPSTLKERLGEDRYVLFCNDFKKEVFDKLTLDVSKEKLDVVVKDIHNDKYAKYKRLLQIELDINYTEGSKVIMLRCQFEISLIESEGELPFEECSLLSKYQQQVDQKTAVEVFNAFH